MFDPQRTAQSVWGVLQYNRRFVQCIGEPQVGPRLDTGALNRDCCAPIIRHDCVVVSPAKSFAHFCNGMSPSHHLHACPHFTLIRQSPRLNCVNVTAQAPTGSSHQRSEDSDVEKGIFTVSATCNLDDVTWSLDGECPKHRPTAFEDRHFWSADPRRSH